MKEKQNKYRIKHKKFNESFMDSPLISNETCSIKSSNFTLFNCVFYLNFALVKLHKLYSHSYTDI